MPIGVTMIKSSDPYFCPPFPRQGEVGIFSMEVLNLESSATLDVEVQHKNSADTAWGSAGTFPTWTGTGTKHLQLTGLKEQIRYVYTVGGPSAESFVHLFVYVPTWRP